VIAAPVSDPLTVADPRLGEEGGGRKLAIVASKGSLDWAYPPLMMANNAADSGITLFV
jgi:DsrE/DsrF/DrsH-like family